MKSTIALSFLFLYFSSQIRGGVDGGGGIGVRCPAGSPKSFEILDLHEARIDGYPSDYNPQSEAEAIQQTAWLFAKHDWNPDTMPLPEAQEKIAEILQPLFDRTEFYDPENHQTYQIKVVPTLPLSDDIGQYHILPGCHLEQIAYFEDDAHTLYIAQNWDDLDWLNRSAVISHELAYFIDRHESMEEFEHNRKMTSEHARHFIGRFFSSAGLTPTGNSIPKAGFAVCSDLENNQADGTFAYLFNDGKGNTSAVFSVIHGHTSFYEMKSSFDGISLEQFTDKEKGSVATSSWLNFTDEPEAPAFRVILNRQMNQLVSMDVLQLKNGGWGKVAPTQSLNCWFPLP